MIPGDGTGPEVVREGLKVLDAVRDGFATELVEFDLGAERYLRTGEVLPDEELERLREMDAILLGAVGDPRVKPGILERDLLLRIRFELDQCVNLRPIVRYPGVETLVPTHGEDDVDLVVVRENSEGLYCGGRGVPPQGHRRTRWPCRSRSTRGTASSGSSATRSSWRCSRTGAGSSRSSTRRTCSRSPATCTSGWWTRSRRTSRRWSATTSTSTPRASTSSIRPSRFDVIVTDNMFGDIITDLGAMIQGGMGIAAGGNINPHGVSMFEPIGGTAPDHTGKGTINPARGDRRGADAAAPARRGRGRAPRRPRDPLALLKMASMRAGEMGFSTSEVGDLVVVGTRA